MANAILNFHFDFLHPSLSSWYFFVQSYLKLLCRKHIFRAVEAGWENLHGNVFVCCGGCTNGEDSRLSHFIKASMLKIAAPQRCIFKSKSKCEQETVWNFVQLIYTAIWWVEYRLGNHKKRPSTCVFKCWFQFKHNDVKCHSMENTQSDIQSWTNPLLHSQFRRFLYPDFVVSFCQMVNVWAVSVPLLIPSSSSQLFQLWSSDQFMRSL